jgi:hypothetical protein
MKGCLSITCRGAHELHQVGEVEIHGISAVYYQFTCAALLSASGSCQILLGCGGMCVRPAVVAGGDHPWPGPVSTNFGDEWLSLILTQPDSAIAMTLLFVRMIAIELDFARLPAWSCVGGRVNKIESPFYSILKPVPYGD